MPDYASLATTAQTLVNGAGRDITLIEFNDTPADATKPWRGAADPRVNPDATLATKGVFVEPSAASRLGLSVEVTDFVKRATQIVIVASTADLTTYQEIIDTDNSRWKIIGMEKLSPATTTLLYFIGLAR